MKYAEIEQKVGEYARSNDLGVHYQEQCARS
jgi:hypothetical protein